MVYLEILLALALMLLGASAAAAPAQYEPYRVLVLHSFRNSLPVNTDWYNGLVCAFAAKTYGIPRWQVVGSSIKNKFELADGKAQLERLPEIDFIDDGPGKAVGINAHIGLRPIVAFGNSDGDIEMLEYTDSGKDAHIELMVHHDDAKREYAYGCDTKIGRLCKGIELAKERGWLLISMKNDWARVFAIEK